MAQLEGRVDGDTAAAPWPPARPPGPSTSGRITGTGAPLKRGWDELDSHGEDADFEAAADGTRPASKRRTRAAEVHNMSERRRRDRINEKMRALQELVPHCDKTDKASILDETIEYLKSLQSQVQVMWMTTGMAPMMLPGGHQPQLMGMGFNSSCMPPTTQVLSQMQSVPPFMNNLLQTQMPGVSSAATSVTDVANQVQKSSIAGPWNPFFHPIDATAATPEVPSLFGYASQMAHQNEIQELLATTAAPASGAESPSSSHGIGTT